MCQSRIRAAMASLQYLNAFISERLTAAAVDIFGAVEKTLVEYQGEISRSKQEIDHLRTLMRWPEVRLHRSAAHQFSPLCCDQEASPDHCHVEEWTRDHLSTLHIKEDHDHRDDVRGPSCRQRGDTTSPPPSEKGEGHEELPSHLYRVLTAEQTADVKAEPDGDEVMSSLLTEEAGIPCGVNPESSGLQQEPLTDPLDDVQHYTSQDWSPSQDHEDPDAPQIKAEKLTSSSPRENTDNNYELPLQPERSVYDEAHSSSPSADQTVTNQTLSIAEEKRRDADGGGCQLSGLTRVSQPFCSVNQSEGVLNGEWIKALTEARRRAKKRQNSSLCSEGGDGIGVEQAVNDLTRERRHTCPICSKRFKESSHLRDHVRIHTGEKPYRCKECGVNFRQSGALTLHTRIHTGERPYQCNDCGRRFNRKGDMETHRVTHTGERPHLCLVCGKSFKRKSNLNTHLKIHAEDNIDYTQPL